MLKIEIVNRDIGNVLHQLSSHEKSNTGLVVYMSGEFYREIMLEMYGELPLYAEEFMAKATINGFKVYVIEDKRHPRFVVFGMGITKENHND